MCFCLNANNTEVTNMYTLLVSCARCNLTFGNIFISVKLLEQYNIHTLVIWIFKSTAMFQSPACINTSNTHLFLWMETIRFMSPSVRVLLIASPKSNEFVALPSCPRTFFCPWTVLLAFPDVFGGLRLLSISLEDMKPKLCQKWAGLPDIQWNLFVLFLAWLSHCLIGKRSWTLR